MAGPRASHPCSHAAWVRMSSPAASCIAAIRRSRSSRSCAAACSGVARRSTSTVRPSWVREGADAEGVRAGAGWASCRSDDDLILLIKSLDLKIRGAAAPAYTPPSLRMMPLNPPPFPPPSLPAQNTQESCSG